MESQARRTWTDDRLDDLSSRVDAGFDRVDRRFEDVDRRFEQLDRRFEQVHRDIGGLRVELTGQIDGLRALMIRLNLALFLAIVGALAAIVARGA